MQGVDLKQVPELATLLDDGEQIGDLLKLPPEKILLRWINYHMKGMHRCPIFMMLLSICN